MTERQIIVHVGAPKAASTYLQRRLRANTAALRRQRAAYPVPPLADTLAGNAKLIPMILDNLAQPLFRFRFPDIDISAMDLQQVLRDLTGSFGDGINKIILSAENFRPRHAAALRSALPRTVSCKIILVVRRQDDWFESIYSQFVKHRHTTHPPAAELKRCLTSGFAPLEYPNWFFWYQTWAGQFEQCELLFLDDKSSPFFNRFLTAAGLSTPEDFDDIPIQNRSLSAHEIAYLLSLDAKMTYAEFQSQRRLARKAAQIHQNVDIPLSLLSFRDRRLLSKAFAASNNALLATLGRNDLKDVFQIAPQTSDNPTLGDVYRSADYARFRAIILETGPAPCKSTRTDIGVL